MQIRISNAVFQEEIDWKKLIDEIYGSLLRKKKRKMASQTFQNFHPKETTTQRRIPQPLQTKIPLGQNDTWQQREKREQDKKVGYPAGNPTEQG